MDMRPIGVFDSGLGGLTAVASLRRILPEEDLIYFGDTARVPYGGRSKETILKYARQDVRFLRSFDLKAILIACGTVTTTSLPTLQSENDLPLVGVVEPRPPSAPAPMRRFCGGWIRRFRFWASPAPCLSPWWKTAGSIPATW